MSYQQTPDQHTTDRRMPEKDRRRTPRFSCAGEAKLICLPSDGNSFPGKIHDLSLGGCRLDLNDPIDTGARTEVVIRINAASFRALGIVKGLRGKLEAGIEFVHLSSGGKDLLEDLISELARLRATIDKLMSKRWQIGAESFRKQVESARFQAVMIATRFPFLETTLLEEILEHDGNQFEEEKSQPEERTRVIPVNLFG